MNKPKAPIVLSRSIEIIQKAAGQCFGWLFALATFTSLPLLFDKEMDIITVLIFALLSALSFWTYWLGRKRTKMRNEFKKYELVLSGKSSVSIANLAAATGKPDDVVKKNLIFMIKKKFFTNAYIDEQNQRIVIASTAGQNNSPAASSASTTGGYKTTGGHGNASDSTQVEYIAYTCPNCGGANKIIKGKTAICDYCGSPIKG